ncbi:hypothetical protein EBQ24_00460 [Allofranklinella schreckenbergeri]|uniref:Uncharacterized protein n=2 Tax=Allofranklinella schreckenbergeri TaxID=1076744 RepID=A0A3M6R8W2_9BURK|nr:hypothetical protein EBQ24_00460 [Allofranklinella schreckenbergeri]
MKPPMTTNALHSHWVMTVRGDARAALRKFERLAQAKAEDVRLITTHDIQQQDSQVLHASAMQPCASRPGRYRQQLTLEKTLEHVRLQMLDFLMPHAGTAWPELRDQVLDMARRIATHWQLQFEGADGLCAGTGQNFNWQGISHVQSLHWVLRLNQSYARTPYPAP